MLIAETVMALGSFMYALPSRRKESISPLRCVVSSSDTTHLYQLSTGVTLEASVKADLEGIDGVKSVHIARDGDDYTVTVVLDELEFPVFEKVAAKELELFDSFPEKNFTFDVMSSASADSSVLSSLTNAAA